MTHHVMEVGDSFDFSMEAQNIVEHKGDMSQSVKVDVLRASPVR